MEPNKDPSYIYYEPCNQSFMLHYPSFFDQLSRIESVAKKIKIEKTTDRPHTHYYILNGISWPKKMSSMIKKYNKYPSEYFIKTIMTMVIENGTIINPPIAVNPDSIPDVYYIPLLYNQLMIIDALMKQGSHQRYVGDDNKYYYSEHSGVISIEKHRINNIIVATNTNRTDENDNDIFLPQNSPDLAKYDYMFHTHPNAKINGGRIKEGVLYEFPSASDIFNFIKYYNEGNSQASIIVSPEGTYVIRPIKLEDKLKNDVEYYYSLQKFIMKLEKMAIEKKQQFLSLIPTDSDLFHKEVGADHTFIQMYNDYLLPLNLFVEFYPRIKRNNEWTLRTINLFYFDQK